MLDALKGLMGGKSQKDIDDLQGLIATAREERRALSTMLDQITKHSSGLAQVSKSLEQVDLKAGAAAGKVEEIDKRIGGLEGRTRTFAEIDKRIQALLDAAAQS